MYGELFVVLEPSGKRNEEISKLIYDIYVDNIIIKSKDTVSVSFSKLNNVIIDTKDINVKIPFGLMVYEPTLLLSVIGEDSVDLPALTRIRERFITNYFQGEYASRFPNVLFDYHKKILKTKHWEAYNYWLLREGDLSFFVNWLTENESQFDDFVEWYNENNIKFNANKKMLRTQF